MNSSPAIHHSHLNSAAQILQLYDGSIPFTHFIKNYFSQQKKFGSRDRKQISNLCYSFFRLGKSFLHVPIKERILLSLKNNNESTQPHWQQIISQFSLPEGEPENIFPWKNKLSETIDSTAFEASFATQPDLFLRIRPGHEKSVLQKLNNANIEHNLEGSAIRLANAAKVEDVLKMNHEVVVQDASSQNIAQFFETVKGYFLPNQTISLFDCCAASGGKSILAKDTLNNINLTVSDIRPSVIANLKKRFLQAGIANYQSFVLDITNENTFNPKQQFDLVIADVPCTGSGTWARTPEQLYYFNEDRIEVYALLQAKILQNAMQWVKPGGFLLYITCSVFEKENEAQIQIPLQNNFTLINSALIKGYNRNADTMYGGLLKKVV